MSRREIIAQSEPSANVLLLEAQIRSYFAQIQIIFNESKNAEENRESFLCRTANIEKLRSEYIELIQRLNAARLQDNPEFEPNFQALNTFDELFSTIQYRVNQLTPSSSNSNDYSKSQRIIRFKSNVKLPPIGLPTFNGDSKNWSVFFERYNDVIHNRDDLSNTDKLQYLLGQLSDTALTTIAGIEPTGSNYALIYSTLEDKYQDIRTLGCSYLDRLLEFKPLQSSQHLNSFLDTCATSIAAFEKLKIDNKLDFLYLYLSLKKIDSETARAFENYARSEKTPSFKSFITFVKEQAKINARTPSHAPVIITKNKPRKIPEPKEGKLPTQTRSFVTSIDSAFCPLCKDSSHKQFYRCTAFLKLTPRERYNVVKTSNACLACLSFFHTKVSCKSFKNCTHCSSQSHHSLLCFSNKPSTSTACTNNTATSSLTADKANAKLQLDATAVSLCSLEFKQNAATTVLLGTAQVNTLSGDGKEVTLRCLIDNASQHNFITTACAKNLSLNVDCRPHPTTVSGFGCTSSNIKGVTHLIVFSKFNKYSYTLRPLIVDKITDQLPTSQVDKSLFTYLSRIPLADERYYEPGKIDMILGAQVFTQILKSGRIAAPSGMPQAFQTTLGFILMGEAPVAPSSYSSQTQTFCAITNERLNTCLRNFFELEEIPHAENKFISPEEQACEEIYSKTTQRDSQGRYIVALPFKTDPSLLGNSSSNAQQRFKKLERRLDLSPMLRTEYNNIFKEYLERGFLVPATNPVGNTQYVIPHLCVKREDKVTSKIRLVLDASSKDAETNISLNEILHKGPNLQSDLFMLLLNFRLFKIAICADIKQMYLQLKVHPEFWKFQRILYRFSNTDPLQLFKFTRVCFGLTCSPYLALRTLKQLADDEGSNYPLATSIINEGQYYMDDVLCTTHTVEEAITVANQLSSMLSLGGFELLKWSSNSSQFLLNYPKEILHPSLIDAKTIDFGTAAGQKVLGIKWEPHNDLFTYEFAPKDLKCTKRNMLSVIAQLFDVLGFAAPVILYAKLLIKELWLLKIDWDDEPPTYISHAWLQFQSELDSLSKISIPRHIGINENCEVTLVAFADASEKAYGTVLYMHTKTLNGICISLLCAKSKVAPVKIISLARLELCAAYLLSKLVRAVVTNYCSRININRIYAFSDSTVALNWINASPHKLKTFIANRVAKIQSNLSPENFFHVSGKENPSDCLSRGLTPAQLASHPLWFNGPTWMKTDHKEWPINQFMPNLNNLPESKTVVLNTVIQEKQLVLSIAERTSDWNKLLRIFVYILRFSKRLNSRGLVTAEDLNSSETYIIRAIQQLHFSDYIDALNKNKSLPRAIKKLRPILVDGIIRVGGRLSACSDISFDHKHPILLPSKNHIVNLIIDNVHRISCHAGPQLTISRLRTKYWILSVRRVVRALVHACVVCFKARPKPYQAPIMADLPACRLDISKPFAHTGIDYCGPFFITLTRRRGIKSQKAYVCVFICLTTRAVHLEVAPDLTTVSFINALKRFLSRRGPIQGIRTDHGSNFLGAKAYLNEIYEFLNATYDTAFKNELASHRISWTFIPPNAPHFGGSWEAAVKSFKTHLIRVIGSQILTYEELLTVLCQIEALLNSRPLGILSEDPAEPFPITPAHFLNTTPLKQLPAADVVNERSHLLSRFSLLDKLVQSYWKRWREEYLHTLQVANKWNTESCSAKIGAVVLIMQDSAPLHWPLGIIEKVYPGPDGRIRVALVKTKNGALERPVIRLCPLPIAN